MLKFTILIFSIFLTFNCEAQTKFKQLEILDNHVKITVPTSLISMSEEMWSYKYHTMKRPPLVLSDKNAEINLLAEPTTQQQFNNSMESYVNERLERLKQRNSGFDFMDHGVKTIHGKQIGFIKFISQAQDQPVFNYYFFLVVDGKYVSCAFNCIQKLQKEWEPIADKIVASVQIID